MDRNQFFDTFFPALMTFLSAVLPALGLWAVTILKTWATKQNEQVNRQALHSAMTTGMASAEQKYQNASPSTQAKVAYAVDYAKKSVPDAIRDLKASTEVLTKIAQSKESKPCPPDSPPPVVPPLS